MRASVKRAVPLEVEARLDVPRRAAVERDHVAGCGARAAFERRRSPPPASCNRRARPKPEAPARHLRRAAGELRVKIDHAGGRVGSEQEQVERFVVDHQRVAAVRPVARHRARPVRRMHEQPPGSTPGAGAPRERRVLVREPGVDAERILDLRNARAGPRLSSGPNFSPSRTPLRPRRARGRRSTRRPAGCARTRAGA